jgi:hypothetical protein
LGIADRSKSLREERWRWLNRPRGGRLGVRVHGKRCGCGTDARPARSDPDLALGCDPVEGMTTRAHTSVRHGEGRRSGLRRAERLAGPRELGGCAVDWAEREKRGEGKKNCLPIFKRDQNNLNSNTNLNSAKQK